MQEFPLKQFVLATGVSWPPVRAGFLDLYSGERGVAKSIRKRSPTWSLCFDLADGADQDLNDPSLQQKIERLIQLGCFIGLGGGPVCRSFSTAIRPPARSAGEPYGKASASLNMKRKMEEGNKMAIWFFSILELGMSLGLAVWIENPNASWMFKLPEWKCLVERWVELRFWVVDYCRFGTAWRKRTKIGSNTILGDQRTLCKGGHQHVLLKGHSKQHKRLWTLVAQPYPRGVADTIARALLIKTQMVCDDGWFDPAEMAKCTHSRVGEASNPGPRKPRNSQRLGLLEEVPLVEPRTVVLQDKIWGGFSRWLSDLLSPGAVRAAMAHPFLLVQFAKEYGNHLYSSGKSLFVFSALACLSATKLRDHQALYGNLLGDGNSLGTG